jgi:ABC-type glycerol-3-phosphate transport system substrate-binding protein
MNSKLTVLGVLALAGAAAACGVSKVKDEHGRKITLVAPSSQSIKQGENNRLVVAIARTGIEGPVQIRFEGLPAGVTVVESAPEIKADDSTATFTLHAAGDAPVEKGQTATVTAIGPEGMSVSERFEIDVVARN